MHIFKCILQKFVFQVKRLSERKQSQEVTFSIESVKIKILVEFVSITHS